MTPRRPFKIALSNGRRLHLGPRTLLMGVVNVTPDSFADVGHRVDPSRAVAEAQAMEADGADILDIGGESTRPGATAVTAQVELARILPVVERLAGAVRVPISVDTYKADVAAAALDRGATIVNDVSGLRYDPALVGVVAERGACLVLMHSRGRSRDMYREASYAALMPEICAELSAGVERARAGGVPVERVILDPGIGFAKHAAHSYAVLGQLDRLAGLGRPLLVGPSRKSFLQHALGDVAPSDRDWGTAAAVTAAVLGGAHVVRVHDVRSMAQVARVADEIRAHQARFVGESRTEGEEGQRGREHGDG